ncbi:MAG TPA: hypothetical protein PLH43_07195 [Acetivibrio sp.]|uniref:O-antigen ligase family protein n=1 Tax=Acetivibrio sp. TaxID=1872092 RepID=UPI002BDAD275|nr:hypothetical protein [Acetivibrio sp.]HOM02594.1 hypothetical protein [Acetivibrio sp.]
MDKKIALKIGTRRIIFNSNIDLVSLAIATLIMSPLLDFMFTYGFGLDNLSSPLVLIISITAILLSIKKIKLNKWCGVFLIFVSFFYIVSCLFYQQEGVIPSMFILWVVIPVILTNFQYNAEKILRYCLYYSTLLIFSFDEILIQTHVPTTRFNQVSLVTSYALVIAGTVLIFHFMYYRNESSIIIKVLYCIQLYYMIIYSMQIARGALLVLITSFVIAIIGKYQGEKRKKPEKQIVLISIISAILLFILRNNFVNIMLWSVSFLSKYGINIGALDKALYFLSQGDVTNGRKEFFSTALEYFWKSPIWGNGIGTFITKNSAGIAFVHNFILQFMYEGGLIFAIPLSFLALKAILATLNLYNLNKNSFVIIAFLSCNMLVKLSFSSNPWVNPMLWLLFGIIINHLKQLKFRNMQVKFGVNGG